MLRSLVARNVCTFIFRRLERSSTPGNILNNGLINNTRGLEGRPLSILSNKCNSFNEDLLRLPASLQNYSPSRSYAARKGTRARKDAKKVKKVDVKKVFVFKQLRKSARMPYEKQRPFDDSHYKLPVDDVYFLRSFQSKKYPFDEAIQCLREAHHPTVYNVPNAPLYLRVNLDLKYPNRVAKCMDGWRSVVEMKRSFLLEGMTRPSVLAFCIEDVDFIDSVTKEGGADLAGGKELIKAIQAGEVNPDEYEYLVAHPSVVPDLTVIRGLIKKKFPTVRSRTISTDLVSECKRLKSGIKISVTRNDREPDFGYIETPIGMLDMDGLNENFNSILMDTLTRRLPNKESHEFVIGCVLSTPGNGFEEFKIELTPVFEEFEKRRAAKSKEYEVEE